MRCSRWFITGCLVNFVDPSRFARWLCVAACLLVLARSGYAQQKGLLDLLDSPGPAKPEFTTKISPETAAQGEVVTLSVHVKLPKHYYIYSTTGEFGGRTKIELQIPDGLESVDDEFISDHEPKVEFEPTFKVEIGKFFDQVTWLRKFRVTAGSGKKEFTGKLTGQYCSGPDAKEQHCIPIIPPYEFAVPLHIAEVGSIPAASTELVFARHVQPKTKSKKNPEPLPIAYDFSLSPTDASPGELVTFSIQATLEEGWHTFSLSQTGEGGQPTKIQIAELDGLESTEENFQADPAFEIEKQDDLTLEVHHPVVTWRKKFRVLSGVAAGKYGLAGTIGCQTCRQGTCLPLTKVPFALGTFPEDYQPRTAKPVATDVTETKPELTTQETPASQPTASIPVKGNSEPPRALLPFIFFSLFAGFLALLAPCSYPMIPITISFFLKQSEAQHKRPLLLALVYCGSIVVAFTLIGVVVSAVYGMTGVSTLASLPWINLFIGAIFVFFGLDMLGLYEFHVPGWMLTWSASKESTGSYVGAIFMAITFTLTSFTCTFPLAGWFLALSSKGDYYWPTIGMLSFGTGFALPILAITAIPGALKRLPKSGGWMTTLKVILGILELGAATKFLSIGDPGGIIFDHVMVMVIWLVLALCCGMYLLGIFRLNHDGPATPISAGRMLVAIAFLVLTGYLTVGLFAPHAGGGWIMNQIIALAPPRIESNSVRNVDVSDKSEERPNGLSITHHGIQYSLEIEEAVAFAKAHNKLLFLDYTGWWCANCREMEKRMTNDAWYSKVGSMVRVQLYMDVLPPTVPSDKSDELLKKNEVWRDRFFDRPSLPMYAIVTPDGETALETYVGSETPDKVGSFVQFLEAGIQKWQTLQAARQPKSAEPIRLANGK